MRFHSRLLRRTTALLCLWAMLFAQGAIAAHWGGMLERVLEAPVSATGHAHAMAASAHGHDAAGNADEHAAHEHAADPHAAHGTPADSGSAGERVCQTHGQFDIQTLDLPRLPALLPMLVGAAIAPVHAASSLQAGLPAAAALGCVRPPGTPPLSVLHCRFLI